MTGPPMDQPLGKDVCEERIPDYEVLRVLHFTS